MPNFCPKAVTLLLAGLIGCAPVASHAAAHAKPIAGAVEPDAPQLLRDIPVLQQKVTVTVTDRPVGDVLAGLTPTLKADLTASREAADQRITLRLINQPVYLLMDRLVRLLSHDPEKPHGYHWESLERPAGSRPAFQFWRDAGSQAEEENARDYPRREVSILLRDLRNLAGMTPAQRLQYQGELPFTASVSEDEPFFKAFNGLSDSQLDSLLDGQTIPLDPALFAKEIAARDQEQRDQMLHQQQASRAAGAEDPFPIGIPNPPDVPPAIRVTVADLDGRYPSLSSKYAVSLDGVRGDSIVLDPYDTNKSRNPERIKPPEASSPALLGPTVDLAPLLTPKEVTLQQRGDVGFTLQALASAAHVNIYQEEFLRPGTVYGTRSHGLKTLKGTLPILIAAVCAEWNYQDQKVGDDYLFWSRTWPQDRAEDVPDRLLLPWKQRLKEQKVFTLDDRAEIAAALTYPQIKLTLEMMLPEQIVSSLLEYHSLRTLGLLSSIEHQAAFSRGGLPFVNLPPWEREEMLSNFKQQLSHVSDDQLVRAVLRCQSDQDETRERVVLRLDADNKELAGTILIGQVVRAASKSGTALSK